ncbi:MAG: hypothetical protein EOM73_13055 [Bacteroidia bacterium]|nr:hypothetical protein [Bacteroidia bacterium]
MNLLTKTLPKAVVVDGVDYPVDTDFRLMVEFETITNGPGSMEDKGEAIMPIVERFFNGNIVFDIDRAVEQFMWFYRCDEKPQKTNENDDTPAKTLKPVYSFEIDAPLIYAAFLDQYNIDLVSIEYLHWWAFRSLLSALRDEHEFRKVIGYRTMKITKDMSPEQRKAYRELKRIHRLPDYRSDDEKESDFANNLDSLF